MSSSISTHRRPWVALAAAAVLALAATGCTSGANADGSDEPAQLATYAGARLKYGESFTYGNGLVVEVKKPAVFVPSAQADGVEDGAGEPVRVRINVINGTSGEFVPNTIGVSVVSAGTAAPQVLDPASGIELTGPERRLGRSDVVAFDLAFVVEDPTDVTVTLTPALAGYDPLVYATR